LRCYRPSRIGRQDKERIVKTGLIPALIAAIALPAAYADNIIVNSSSAVTFLANGTSTTSDFPSAFTTGNFNSAKTGADAAVLTTTPFYTAASALTTAGAEWIGTSAGAGSGSTPGYTALYAISFTIPDAFVSGTLSLNYEVDNALGDTNAGVYLNGAALPNSTGIPCGVGVACTASFDGLQTYTDNNISADLVQGTNWLYLDDVNLGSEAGLIFSATISTVNAASSVPESSSVILLSILLLLMVVVVGRKRTAAQAR
jgi:hypothetical protein